MQIIKTTNFIEAKNSIQVIEEALLSFAEEPHKAYILANALGKVTDKIQKQFKDEFNKYWNNNKSLPWGFDVRESTRTAYEFSEDWEWYILSQKLKEREEKLKRAWELSDKWEVYYDENAEQIPLVKRTFTPMYPIYQIK